MSTVNKKRNDKSSEGSQEKLIRQLTKENERLKNEVASLKNEIQQSNVNKRRWSNKKDANSNLFLHQARRENTFSQSSYLSYFTSVLKNASLFRLYSQILNTVRHFTFVTTTIKVVMFLLTIIQSSAIFVISTSAFIIYLPFTFLVSGIGTMLTLFGSRKATRINRPILSDKNVCVFFPAKKSVIREDSYFAGFVKSMAENPNTVCMIVTHGFFFSHGITKCKKYFFTSRIDADNLIIVRRHYYYSLKKNVILPYSKNLTEIY